MGKIAGCACAGNAGNVFPTTAGELSRLASRHVPWCITACRDECRDRYLAVSFEVGGGENVPGIPRARAIRDFAYLERGPHHVQQYIVLRMINMPLSFRNICAEYFSNLCQIYQNASHSNACVSFTTIYFTKYQSVGQMVRHSDGISQICHDVSCLVPKLLSWVD